MATKKGFFKRNYHKIKTWACRLSSCTTFGLVLAKLVVVTIPVPAIAIPSAVALIASFIIKHGPKTIEEIKKYMCDELKNEPEMLSEVLSTLSDLSQATTRSEPIDEQPIETQRKPVHISYNVKTGNLEYVCEE